MITGSKLSVVAVNPGGNGGNVKSLMLVGTMLLTKPENVGGGGVGVVVVEVVVVEVVVVVVFVRPNMKIPLVVDNVMIGNGVGMRPPFLQSLVALSNQKKAVTFPVVDIIKINKVGSAPTNRCVLLVILFNNVIKCFRLIAIEVKSFQLLTLSGTIDKGNHWPSQVFLSNFHRLSSKTVDAI